MHTRIEASHLDPDQLPQGDVSTRTDAQLVEPVLNAIQVAVADCSVTAARIFAGRAYEHKGHIRTTAFGETIASGYASESNDFYLEIGIRVPYYAAQPVLEAIGTVETLTNEQKIREIEERLARAKTSTASAQSNEAHIQAELDRLKPHPKTKK